MTAPAAARDAGLQPERTRLAWRRTTLACSVAAVLGLRQALRGPGTPADAAGAGVIVLLWMAFLWVAHLRMRELAEARPRGLASGTALAAVACTVALAVFAVALLVLPAVIG
ncbi:MULTISPECIES: DUF202 domain-containing protein [Streptomyces]|uniref:DUF202 domain-containing protein n=1 Tax=Streptomyces TaxID=1883 RepID=UPI002271D8C2|nr:MULTISPECIES: DUF202 domain-containing protein [unclassified Streptomyces]MCY0946955.1 DUF202 domain-containing protein [Streptomyces sp. H34-AA3]MCY0952369.1 DUF202 domain-containing protein [Streptomyces sp. H27-S2]MCZ4085843.1 DUF202 domain-containing protein [Streptomyces sp. H34-S5]